MHPSLKILIAAGLILWIDFMAHAVAFVLS